MNQPGCEDLIEALMAIVGRAGILLHEDAKLYEVGTCHGQGGALCVARPTDTTLAGKPSFVQPQGVMLRWARTTGPLDIPRLFAAAVDAGVLYVPGTAFCPDLATMRFSYARPTLPKSLKAFHAWAGRSHLSPCRPSSRKACPRSPPNVSVIHFETPTVFLILHLN